MTTALIIAIVVGSLIQLAMVVVFFVMAYNVVKIKQMLRSSALGQPGRKNYMLAQEERFLGNKEKEEEYLRRASYYQQRNRS